jgi:beta-phosphoglucomutase
VNGPRSVSDDGLQASERTRPKTGRVTKPAPSLKGVIFDMDGVLSDSEQLVRAAAMEMFRTVHGVNVQSSDFEPFVGSGEECYLLGVAARHALAIEVQAAKASTNEIYYSMIKGRLRPVRGAVRFLRRCQATGLKTALATGTRRERAGATLRELGLGETDFTGVVTGSDVTRMKPAPDIFLAAARAIGLEPDRCLVIEDALLGVRAAKSAGSYCLGLGTSFNVAALRQAGADWVAPSFARLPKVLLEARPETPR